MSNVKKGDRVQILIDSPTGNPIEGTVAIVQDVPGKLIGVIFDKAVKGGHSLDGLTQEWVSFKMKAGKGCWTRPENIEVL